MKKFCNKIGLEWSVAILICGISSLSHAQNDEYHPPTYLGQTEMAGLIDMQLSDINGNGNMDIVAISRYNIGWYENKGNGQFGAFQLVAESDKPIESAEVGDVTDNGFPDIVWVKHRFELILQQNNGDGTWSEGIELHRDLTPRQIQISKWSDEGKNYLFFRNHIESHKVNKMDLSNPHEPSIEELILGASRNDLRDFRFEDVTGNGKMDLLNSTSNQLSITLQGDSSWSQKEFWIDPDQIVSHVATCDFTQNDHIDLIVSTYARRRDLSSDVHIYIIKNNGNGNFDSPFAIDSTTAQYGFERAMCFQTNQDDSNKIIVTPSNRYITDNNIYYYDFLENGAISERNLLFEADHIYDIILPLDVNQNGKTDLVAASFTSSQIVWFENDSNNNFLPQKIIGESHTSMPLSFAFADFSGSGYLDIVVGSQALGKGLMMYENIGNLQFHKPNIIDPSLEIVNRIDVVDMNNNGLPDLVVQSVSRSNEVDTRNPHRQYNMLLSWYPNNGDGTFAPAIPIKREELTNFGNFVLADINGNGHLDVIYNNNKYIENHGNAEFSDIKTSEAGHLTRFISGDIDGDGAEEVMGFISEHMHVDETGRPIIGGLMLVQKYQPDIGLTVIDTVIVPSRIEAAAFYRDEQGSANVIASRYNATQLRRFQTTEESESKWVELDPINLTENFELSVSNILVSEPNQNGSRDIYTSSSLRMFFETPLEGKISKHRIYGDGSVKNMGAVDSLRYGLRYSKLIDLNNNGHKELVAAISGEDRIAIYQSTKVQSPDESGLSVWDENDMPTEFALFPNYPNPFNPVTTIRYKLPASSAVRLEVFDMLGRRVAVLVNNQIEAGTHLVNFDAGHLASGMYIYRLQAGDYVQTNKMMLIK